MCESSVYVREDSGDKLVAEDVARIIPKDGQVKVYSLLGDETKVNGEIVEIDLMSHRIIVQSK